MNCPVCGSELTRTSELRCAYGVEEYAEKCEKCNLYSEQYAYGHTEITIGQFMTGYLHNTSEELKDEIFESICALGKIIKEKKNFV